MERVHAIYEESQGYKLLIYKKVHRSMHMLVGALNK